MGVSPATESSQAPTHMNLELSWSSTDHNEPLFSFKKKKTEKNLLCPVQKGIIQSFRTGFLNFLFLLFSFSL